MFHFVKENKYRFLGIFLAAVVMMTSCIACFADDTWTLSTGIASITGALSDLSGSNIVLVLVAAVTFAIPLILVWFAFRKIWSWAKSAFYSG